MSGPARAASVSRANSGAQGLGVARVRVLHDGDDESALGLRGEPEVHGVELHDLPGRHVDRELSSG